MDTKVLADFVKRGQRAQAAVDQIIEANTPKTDSQKITEIQSQLKAFCDGEQGPIPTLDAIDSIVNYD